MLALASGGLLAGAEPSATQANSPVRRVVVLGDSITAGYGLDPDEAYPALLQKKIEAAGRPFQITNAGVSGDTTAGGLRRINWILAQGADVLIVALGGNDGLRGISPKQTAENLAGIIQRARAKIPGLVVIVAGMQMPGNMGPEYTTEFREVFPRVAKETGSEFVPFLLEGVGGITEMNQPDLIHPNVAGQQRVAENVWAVLEKVVAPSASSGAR